MVSSDLIKPHSPKNEPIMEFRRSSEEREALIRELKNLEGTQVEVPLIINGKEVRTGNLGTIRIPHRKNHILGVYHKAGVKEVEVAISFALKASKIWSRLPYQNRASIFRKAAELLSKKHRFLLNASTMLGQSKTCHQAEIDAACEMIDFLNFNAHFLEELHSMQPLSTPTQVNRMEYRPLEGFVLAVSPFNFTSIGGNLPTSAALMGNVAIWKPASTSVFSNYFLMKLFMEAGLPEGVIQFLPGDASVIGTPLLTHSSLSGLHFTGSTGTFHSMWKTIASHLEQYKSYPRIVGETGGKNFVFAHASCDLQSLVSSVVRGAFEYQGQKCSAASRVYIPKSLSNAFKEKLIDEVKTIRMGDVSHFENFMGAVIDQSSFHRIDSFIKESQQSKEAQILVGGEANDEIGYFISPTVIEVKNPRYRTMREEIFGPVLSLYVYEDHHFEETLEICDTTTPYGLTGAVFSQDKKALQKALDRFLHSAGNLYINNKPTGAVVGQQPFGGGRASGTNDKAGSVFNLLRWVSIRTVSETLTPIPTYRYPYME